METRLPAGRVLRTSWVLVDASCEVCIPIWAIFAVKPLEGFPSLSFTPETGPPCPTSPPASLGTLLDAAFAYISIAIAYTSAFEMC